MAKRDEVFPSKYPKASDLNGKPIAFVIESAVQETLKTLDGIEQGKTVLYFKKAKKALPLNLTNCDAVADATGEDDIDLLPGHRIELYPTTKEKPPAPKPSVADDMDDEIPFA